MLLAIPIIRCASPTDCCNCGMAGIACPTHSITNSSTKSLSTFCFCDHCDFLEAPAGTSAGATRFLESFPRPKCAAPSGSSASAQSPVAPPIDCRIMRLRSGLATITAIAVRRSRDAVVHCGQHVGHADGVDRRIAAGWLSAARRLEGRCRNTGCEHAAASGGSRAHRGSSGVGCRRSPGCRVVVRR